MCASASAFQSSGEGILSRCLSWILRLKSPQPDNLSWQELLPLSTVDLLRRRYQRMESRKELSQLHRVHIVDVNISVDAERRWSSASTLRMWC